MFKQKCFIRKDTKLLRKELKKIGYRRRPIKPEFDNNEYLQVYTDGCYNTVHPDSIGLNFYIDCKVNEKLFLAIAALRDNTDNNQWFIHQDGSFLKCECDSKVDMWGDFEYPEIYPRKATVEELIKYFAI